LILSFDLFDYLADHQTSNGIVILCYFFAAEPFPTSEANRDQKSNQKTPPLSIFWLLINSLVDVGNTKKHNKFFLFNSSQLS
jgi:hypothetical protein